jgi:GWxTD domain-containing protein
VKFIATILFSINLFYSFGQIEALFDLKRFHTTEENYIETYLYLYGNTLKSSNDTNENFKKVEILQFIENNEKEIVAHQKYILKEAADYVERDGIMDLKRFILPSGTYTINVVIKDLNDTLKVEKHQEEFDLNFPESPHFSDIEFLDSYWKNEQENELSKSGLQMIPLVTSYFGPEFKKLAYYFEIYGMESFKETSHLLLKQSILIKETNEIAGQYNRLKKIPTNPIHPILNTFDLSNLPTGNYTLSLELIDTGNNSLFKKTIPFQRTNLSNNMQIDRLNAVQVENTFVAYLSSDSLAEFMQCLSPIATHLERNIIDKKLDNISDTLKKQFIFSFWYNRSPGNPGYEWEKYKNEVKKADQLFATKVRRGYETDRGRIYLKYGPPNTITDRPNEPSAYPYQIWHYYKIGKFNNKRFIFYMPDLGSNEYTILHSTLQGEYFNNNWKTDLHKRNTPGRNVDGLQNPNDDQWGSNSNTFFINP